MTDTALIEAQAAQWRVRQDNPQWSAEDQQALEAWLEASTAHRVAWLRMQYGWQRVDRLAALRTPSIGRRRPWQMPASRWSGLAMAAGMLVAVALSVLGVTQWLGGGTQHYVTAVGGHETVPLKDGSRIELNTDTRIRTAVDETARTVWLEKGEVYFDIARDPGRPFVVNAGDHRVVVLGTRFSVRREGGRLEVTVEEGHVQVEVANATKPTPPAIATRGDRVIAESGSMLLAAASVQKVENQLSWRHGVLVFDKTSLAAAAAEFNRYNARKLKIDDAETADVRISGSFDATNVDAFARLLQRAYGLHVRDQSERIVISN